MIKALKKAKDKLMSRIELHAAYRRVFDSPDGEKVLAHICKEGFVSRSTFVAGDSHETAMNEGSRRLALSILRFHGRNHETLVKQIEEQAYNETE